jgi:hypothetical protein
MQNMMRRMVLPVLAVTIGSLTPVLAADVVVGERYVREVPVAREALGPFTLQEALVVAQGIGVVTVQHQFRR